LAFKIGKGQFRPRVSRSLLLSVGAFIASSG
jgi:hypothetical protein